jgi:hypothetical protein
LAKQILAVGKHPAEQTIQTLQLHEQYLQPMVIMDQQMEQLPLLYLYLLLGILELTGKAETLLRRAEPA